MADLVDPEEERRRIEVLHGLQVLDTPREERFDRITRLARRTFGVGGPGTSVYFRDPDGSLLEFISYG